MAVFEAQERVVGEQIGDRYRQVCPELYEPVVERMAAADVDEYAVRVLGEHSGTGEGADYWLPYVREVCSRDPDQFLDEFFYLAILNNFDDEEVPYLRVGCRDRFVEAYQRLGLDINTDAATEYEDFENLGS